MIHGYTHMIFGHLGIAVKEMETKQLEEASLQQSTCFCEKVMLHLDLVTVF